MGDRRRRGRVAAVAAVVVVVLAAGVAVWSLLRPGPATLVVVEVPPGAPAGSVLRGLHDKGLLPWPAAGRAYLAVAAGDRPLRYGTYRIAPRSTPVQVLDRLVSGKVEMVSVTIVEGSSLGDIIPRMVGAGIGSEASWRALTSRADWVRDLAPGGLSLEGFLYPDTYRFAEGVPAAMAARHMVGRFRAVWSEVSAGALPAWGSPLEVVTLASLVEAETAVAEERAHIAGVFLNRLRRGMLLQCDPTVVYALRRQGLWAGRLLRADWQLDDPYNTYRYPGLPPGPINSPGRAAIEAALRPEKTADLYFVARPDGGHAFSRTLAQHNRAVARLRRSRR